MEGRAYEHSDDPYCCLTCNPDSQSQQFEDLTLLSGDRNTEESDPIVLSNMTEGACMSATQSSTNESYIDQTLPKHIDMQIDQTRSKQIYHSPNQTHTKQKCKPADQTRPKLLYPPQNQMRSKQVDSISIRSSANNNPGPIRVNTEPSYENPVKVKINSATPLDGAQSDHLASAEDPVVLPNGRPGT